MPVRSSAPRSIRSVPCRLLAPPAGSLEAWSVDVLVLIFAVKYVVVSRKAPKYRHGAAEKSIRLGGRDGLELAGGGWARGDVAADATGGFVHEPIEKVADAGDEAELEDAAEADEAENAEDDTEGQGEHPEGEADGPEDQAEGESQEPKCELEQEH